MGAVCPVIYMDEDTRTPRPTYRAVVTPDDSAAVGGFSQVMLDTSSAAVVPGDAYVSANQSANGNVTRAVASSIAGSTAVSGVVVVGGSPGTLITGQVSGVCPSAITGLGSGVVAKVAINGVTGKLVRVPVPDGSEKIVGTCDAQGNLTLAPSAGVGSHSHHVINVAAAPYNCIGDGVTDCSAGIQAAVNQAIATGRAVYFPGQGVSAGGVVGTFAISKAINVIGNGVAMFGDVKAAALLGSQYAAGVKALFPAIAGSAAKISALSANPNANQSTFTNIMTVVGLAGLTANNVQVGDSITLNNCAAGNVGTHTILSINLGAQSLTCCNNNFAQVTPSPGLASTDSGTGGTGGAPTIVWAINPPMFRLYGSGNSVVGLRFDGNGVASCGLDITQGATGGSVDNNVEDCGFLNMPFGIKVADYGPNPIFQPNCDTYRFYRCCFTSLTYACMYAPNCTQQSREYVIEDCAFNNSPYGFWFYITSFTVRKLVCSAVGRVSQFGLGSIFYGSIVNPTTVQDLTAENCGRVYQGTGVSATLIPFAFDGFRFDSSAGDTPADAEIFQAGAVGGLVLKNGWLGSAGPGHNYKVGILNAGTVGAAPVHVILENVMIARNDLLAVQARTDTGGVGNWYSKGCQCNDGTFTQAIPDGYHVIGVGAYNPLQVSILSRPSTVAVLPTPGGINHLADLFTSSVEYINSTGGFSIGSHAHSVISAPLEGRELEFNYYGAHAMTLLHQDSTDATVANRFDCPGGSNLVFPPGNAFFRARWSSRKGMWEVTGLGPTAIPTGGLVATATASALSTAPSSTTIVTVGSVSLTTTQPNQRVQISLSGSILFPASSTTCTFGIATDSTTVYDQSRTVDGVASKRSQLSMQRSTTVATPGAHAFNVLAQLGAGASAATIEMDLTVNAYGG